VDCDLFWIAELEERIGHLGELPSLELSLVLVEL
jgi:hypothetical protein